MRQDDMSRDGHDDGHDRDSGEGSLDRAEAFLDAGNGEPSDSSASGGMPSGSASAEGETDPERLAEVGRLGEAIVAQLQSIYDPEIPVDIYQLGLIYRIDVHDDNAVTVEMTLTSPHCPVAESLPLEVQHKVEALGEVPACEVKIVWEPPWHPSMMTEEAQLELGMIY